MSPKINVLSAEVANHIAAGEVIERPASVVKELVENSIDAGATQLEIDIGVGGKSYIRIKDNGHGMSRENAALAFERHATSKIACTEDISTIATLGFRGEALPSIASVSKLKLLTQPPDEVIGTRIEIYGGEMIANVESGASPGTFIEVGDLFYKTPARLKFLKSSATELGYINNVITDIALANPQVGFSINNNGKNQLHLPASSTLLQRIAGLFGRELVRELVEIHETAASVELRGLIGLPSCNRANRNYQKAFVNNRPVKDKTISHAIQQAYDTLIPKGRHPVAFLFLSLPVELVDVNVHPTKAEIRFINSQAIHDIVARGIRRTLSQTLGVSVLPSYAAQRSAKTDSDASQDEVPFESFGMAQRDIEPPALLFSSNAPTPRFTPSDGFLPESEMTRQPALSQLRYRREQNDSLSSDPQLARSIQGGSAVFSRMLPIGQFQETYILAQDGEDLFIIDQHAAHERVFYEKFKAQFQQNALDVQPLLFPVSLELSHREQAILEEHLDALRQYGFEVEPFGGMTWLIKAVPALLAKADYKKLLYDMLDQLGDTKTATIEQKFDGVLKLMACHGAIRAHHRLQDSQIFALLQQMDALELPYTCPHGRPTVIKITLQDLEKRFGRI